MKLNSVNIYNNTSFGHGTSEKKSPYSKKDRLIIAGMTTLGTAASCAILAKKAGYSLNPSKMFKNIKNSYLAKVVYHDEEVIPIGIGSALGGLAGGYMVDKNPENRRAKRRETLMQIGNVSIPILTVKFLSKKCKKYGKVAQACGAIGGIIGGVYLANFAMNKLNDLLFRSKTDRGIKATDFSAHLDDTVVAASYISSSPIVHCIARTIPIALMCAGNEVGNKTAN